MLSSATAGLVEAYRRDGFVRVAGVLEPDEVARFAEACRTLAGRVARLSEGTTFDQYVNVWQRDGVLRELTLHPRLAALATELAGVPLRIWHDQTLIKKPHTSTPTEFHQDRPFWPHATCRQSLSAWVALVDVPPERGCMTFIPGSQSIDDLHAQDLTDPESLFDLRPELRWEPRVTVPLRAGDCTFHHSYCAHAANSNLTDSERLAHVVIFMDEETTFDGSGHVVTDPLGLSPGDPLAGELFPKVPA